MPGLLALAALLVPHAIHVYFFVLESLLFSRREAVRRQFGVRPEHAQGLLSESSITFPILHYCVFFVCFLCVTASTLPQFVRPY